MPAGIIATHAERRNVMDLRPFYAKNHEEAGMPVLLTNLTLMNAYDDATSRRTAFKSRRHPPACTYSSALFLTNSLQLADHTGFINRVTVAWEVELSRPDMYASINPKISSAHSTTVVSFLHNLNYCTAVYTLQYIPPRNQGGRQLTARSESATGC